jgi:hypothetical protein
VDIHNTKVAMVPQLSQARFNQIWVLVGDQQLQVQAVRSRDDETAHAVEMVAVIKATDQYQDIVWDAVREPFGRRVVTVI